MKMMSLTKVEKQCGLVVLGVAAFQEIQSAVVKSAVLGLLCLLSAVVYKSEDVPLASLHFEERAVPPDEVPVLPTHEPLDAPEEAVQSTSRSRAAPTVAPAEIVEPASAKAEDADTSRDLDDIDAL